MNEDFRHEKSSADPTKQVTAAREAMVDLERDLENSVDQAESEDISNRLKEANDQYVALIKAVNEQL